MICKYAEIFCWKNVSSFCTAKATHIFSAKNIRILYIESAKTVNEMTLNDLHRLKWVCCSYGQWDSSLLDAVQIETDHILSPDKGLSGQMGSSSKCIMDQQAFR